MLKNYENLLKYMFIVFIVAIIVLFILIFLNIIKIDRLNGIIANKKFRFVFSCFAIIMSISYIVLPGFIEGHDIYDRLSHIQALTNEIKNGTFPVYIFSDYLSGYGLGMGLVYTDFFYYIPAFLHVVGVPLLLSYKILIIIIVFSTYFSMLFCTKKITKSIDVSIMISSLYVLSSYFLNDLYIRADIGENLAMIFIPFILLGLYEIIFSDNDKGYYLTIGLVGVYISHILSCYLCIFLVLFIVIANIKSIFNDKKRLKNLLIYGLLSVGIVSFLWIPMFDSMFSNNMVIANQSNSDLTSSRVLNPLFVFGELFYYNVSKNWTPPGIGFVFIFLTLLFIFDKNKKNKYSTQLIIIGYIFLFMTTYLFPWSIGSKIFGVMEFPWRFYFIVTSCLLFGFSMFINNTNIINKTKLFILLSLFMIFTYTFFTYNIFIYSPMYKDTYEIKYSVASGYELPIGTDVDYINKRGQIITSNNDIDITFEKKGTNMNIIYSNNKYKDSYIDLPLIYYKGYVAKDNGNKIVVNKSDNNLIRLNICNDSGKIEVYYGLTNTRLIGYIISIISFVYFVLICKIRRNYVNNNNKRISTKNLFSS